MKMKKIIQKAIVAGLVSALCFQSVNLQVHAEETDTEIVSVDTVEEVEDGAVVSEVEDAVVDDDTEASEEAETEVVEADDTEASEEAEADELAEAEEGMEADAGVVTEDAADEETEEIPAESFFAGDNFEVTFKAYEQWEGGFNATITVKNTSDILIHDWILEYDKEYEFNTIWNAIEFDTEDEMFGFKNAVWNQDILPGQTVEFGFQGKGDFAGCPTNYAILGTCEENAKEDYSIEYILDTDWGTGFAGRILITNLTEKTLEDWFLEFDFGRKITYIWDAVIEEQEGTHYSLKNADYNCNIAPGQTISFGFLGEDGDASVVPYDFHLSTYTPSSALVKIERAVADYQIERAKAGIVVIGRVNEETKQITLLDTKYDEENQLDYTFVNKSQADDTYILVDIEEFYKKLAPSYKESVFKTDQIDVVLVLDVTGSMSSMLSSLKTALKNFDSAIRENGVDPRYGLVLYGDITVKDRKDRNTETGYEDTIFVDWFDTVSDVISMITTYNPGNSTYYYGGDDPESAYDGLYVGMNLEMREAAHQYMILLTDINAKDGIVGNMSYGKNDASADVLMNGIVTSFILSSSSYVKDYEIIAKTSKGEISTNYKQTNLSEDDPMTMNLISHVNSDCWVRLVDGSVVKLDKDPRLGDTSVDTDQDGISDVDELGEIVQIEVVNPETMEIEYYEAWTFTTNPVVKDAE